jgi:hypothetical protein
VSPSVNIELTPAGLRRALDLLEQGPYESLDALVESLIVSGNGSTRRQTAQAPGAAASTLGQRPPMAPELTLAAEPAVSGQLQFLTNRFGPIKLATRVLANLARDGAWPAVTPFQRTAANEARDVGERLRSEDKAAARRGSTRRWVAYPVGEDERAAHDRFVFSFTVAVFDRRLGGPLAQLGLVGGTPDAVALTDVGWELAAASSPTLDGVGEGTLGDDEIRIFRSRLLALSDEAAAVREFLRAVRRGGGIQGRVDELLSTWHAEWTGDRAAAERAAQLGRLGELRVLRVAGRGPSARIELLESKEFEGED